MAAADDEPVSAIAPVSADGRAVRQYDAARAEAAVRELLIAVGEDPQREGLRDTPARVAAPIGRSSRDCSWTRRTS